MANSHKIQLPQLAVKALRDVLESPGWARLTSDHSAAAKMLDGVVPEVTPPDEVKAARSQSEARVANAAWSDEAKAFELSDKQRDTARKALRHHLEQGNLPPGRYTFALLSQFGLAEE